MSKSKDPDEPFGFMNGVDYSAVSQFLLATPVQLFGGYAFYKSFYHEVLSLNLGMSVLVVLGTSSAYGYSVATLVARMAVGRSSASSLHFDTSSMLITFVLMGKWLESRAKRSASTAISKLLALRPSTATRVVLDEREWRCDGSEGRGQGDEHMEERDIRVLSEEVVPTSALRTGDVVKVLPGQKIPADGVVVHGLSTVDEAMITGESMPVQKERDSLVIGTCMNNEGALVVRLTAVGEDTALAQIAKLVETAQASRAPVQDFADRVSGVFVPIVCFSAAVTLAVWLVILCMTTAVPNANLPLEYQDSRPVFALMLAISVLVVACPCALGLAVPTAIMVGTGVGAELGIIIKDGGALEAGSTVTAVVLDKTGTITLGRPEVSDIYCVVPHKRGGGGGGVGDERSQGQAEKKDAGSREAALNYAASSTEAAANKNAGARALNKDKSPVKKFFTQLVAKAGTSLRIPSARGAATDSDARGGRHSSNAPAEKPEGGRLIGAIRSLERRGIKLPPPSNHHSTTHTDSRSLALALFLIGSAERGSEHPVAKCIISRAEAHISRFASTGPSSSASAYDTHRKGTHLLVEPTTFEAFAGLGIAATVAGHTVTCVKHYNTVLVVRSVAASVANTCS